MRNSAEAGVGRLGGDDGGEAAWFLLGVDSVEGCEWLRSPREMRWVDKKVKH